MNHEDHVALLRPANLPPGGTWADLGAGWGAFTLALRELVGPQASIYAVDQDRHRLTELEAAYRQRFGAGAGLHLLAGDFSRPLGLPPLDGLVMANSLHYFKDKVAILRKVGSLIKPGGILLVVEYNVDHGNIWVPYPFTFERFASFARAAGYQPAVQLGSAPSSFLREFYSAEARKPVLRENQAA